MVRIGTYIGINEYKAVLEQNYLQQKKDMEKVASCPEELEILLIEEEGS
jgi:hypothetical protein